ncbi:TRAPP II complex [Cristinia sonorae]|uniref:TRAPP II complex n=1 Tax=Cristinia sonorae TaxID=1940300 RepID=A0A8K0UYJ8_9AGAR|nr:TRAPP II complex [Cristinia sonorae]
MDPLAFASLAHVRILLLPVGSIKRPSFEKWASEIRSFDTIRLGDIPADPSEEKARFMPSPLATGYLHLSYPSHPPPTSMSSLQVFRPSDFPLGVIGVATCSATDSLSSILGHFNAAANELFPPGSTFPMARNCFVFEESDDNTNMNLGNTLPGLIVIPSMMGNKKIYVGTLLAELCSNILGRFATMTQALESPLGNEYLNATMFPILPSPSDIPKPIDADTPVRVSLPPLPSYNSQPELVTPGSSLRAKTPTPLTLKRNSSAGPGMPPSPYRHNSMPVKKRQNAIGAVSSHGRLFKVLGDLFLLSGRTLDASVWYTEAIIMLKNPQDTVWHASALEGMATVQMIDAWSATQAGSELSDEKEPWSEIAEKLVQSIGLYAKSPTMADGDVNYALISYLYSRAVLRHTSLLYSIWAGKGWGPLAFSIMLQYGLTSLPPALSSESTSVAEKRLTFSGLERLTSITGISRATIAATLTQVHGPWLLHLGTRDRILVLEAMATVYGAIGYKRKEAYILREVLGCVMDLVVCEREETGGIRTAGTGLGLGIQGVNLGRDTTRGAVGVRENDSTEGNQSIVRIVKYVCLVHGIDLEAVRLVEGFLLSGDDQKEPGQPSEDSPHDLFGWPELQIGIVREAIAVAEALPDYPSVAQFSLSALKSLHPVMSEGDQHHLYNTAARALATARRRGDSRSVEYWSGRPIVSMEVIPLPLVRIPMEKPLSILMQRRSDHIPILTGMTDPFLYNPRKLASAQGQAMLVENESFDIVVTLRNPYVFDLELSSLLLLTTGVRIDTQAIPVIIPANSFHPVTITAKPLEPGLLTIRGCVAQAPGGSSQEFVLPLSTEEEEQKQSRRRSARDCEMGRSKYTGLESRPWDRGSKRASGTTQASQKPVKYLQCKVVPEQPLLRIRRTSLTHGAVMLYNGETTTIRVTLENVSALPIDFLRLTFDDSTIAPAQQALSEGELTVFETYETEYSLIRNPVFTWDSKRNPQDIKPTQKIVISVNCFGKVGCSSGAMHISYSYTNRKRDTLQEPQEVFHTRQLSYPVLVTVYHMLECHSMDILPYSPDTVAELLATMDESEEHTAASRRTLLNVSDVAEWCIFTVDVRNTYGLPFEVTFERDQPDVEEASTTLLVPPGSIIVLPIKKFRLSNEHVSQHIPTLSDRQFVITKSTLTKAEEQLQRELFWYREEILKYIKCSWRETGGSRSGNLSLRQQRMTQLMLKVLRTEETRVDLSLYEVDEDRPDEPPQLTDFRGGRWLPKPNSFVYLRTKITNLSPETLIGVLDLSFQPAQHIIFEGVSSGIPISKLTNGESFEVEMPITFVSSGRFDLTSQVRRLGQPAGWIGHGHLTAIVDMFD